MPKRKQNYDLRSVPTWELFEELKTREGVEDAGFFEPLDRYEIKRIMQDGSQDCIKGDGCASILIVVD